MEKQIQGCSISCLLIIAQTQQLEIFMTALTGYIFSNNYINSLHILTIGY